MKTIDDIQFQEAKLVAAVKLALLNPSTAGTYRTVARRLVTRKVPQLAKTKPSARIERAALRCFQMRVVKRCKDLPTFHGACEIFKWSAEEIIQSISSGKWSYNTVPQLTKDLPSGGHEKNTKLKLLPLLPDAWRQQFIGGIQSTAAGMPEAFMLMALSGCRPTEICTSEITIDVDGLLTIRFRNAKRRAHQGVHWRQLRLKPPPSFGDISGLVDPATLASMRKLTPKQISDVARKTSRRVFPALGEKVSASTFRHQFASDLKLKGCSKREISLALGHSMISSANGYGRPKHGFTEHIRIEITGNFEPKESPSARSKVFLDIACGHEVPLH